MNKFAPLLGILLLGACAIQPKYERPAVELPQAWKESSQAALEQNWWRIYADPQLERLVDEAVARNTNLMLAAARVDESRALLQAADAAFYPTVDGSFSRSRSLSSAATGLLPPGIPRERNNYRAAIDVSYELDLWGRLRTTSAAARADLLASEAARETVRIALVADVAKAYFGLRALDAQIAATRRTLSLREEGLNLQRKRYDGGTISQFDYRQLEAEAAGARAALPPLERDREAQEAALSVLLGRSPKEIMESSVARATGEDTKLLAPVVPAGLP